MLHSKAIQWLAIWKDVIMPSYGNMIDLIFFFNVCADNKPVSIVAHWLKHIAPIHECDMNRNWRPNIRKFLLENLHLLKFINIFRVTLSVHMIRQPMAMRVSIVCQKSDRYLSVAEPIRAHFNWFLEQTLMWKETLMWTGNKCDMELMNGNPFGILLEKKWNTLRDWRQLSRAIPQLVRPTLICSNLRLQVIVVGSSAHKASDNQQI